MHDCEMEMVDLAKSLQERTNQLHVCCEKSECSDIPQDYLFTEEHLTN